MKKHSDRWPVDAHVHFHEPGSVACTLDAAAANFRAAGGGGDWLGALLLAQAAGERVFEELRTTLRSGGWSLAPVTGEPETLIARRGKEALAIVCGRQLRTGEGLEVLALGTLATFADHLPLPEALREVRATGALAVLPWGFGKWMGRRGASLAALLGACSPEEIFIGDNGGRLASWPEPATLRAAARRGLRVLPGSDPFPFGDDHRRVGAFGCYVDAAPPETAPWRTLRATLEALPGSPAAYGRACGFFRFVRNQVGTQLRRRARSGAR